ncbi:MAG: two-component sensor histidine kinase [Hyphomicrobiales bacterium]|nr:MAG: two-component sensor histidine kinase [Hyphomicrobiales bacterium]
MVLLALLIFVLDTVTDMEIAMAVFYIVIILLSVRIFTARQTVLVAIACIALTILSFFLTVSGARDAGLVNCAISCTAILVCTYLVLKTEAAEAAAREARAQLEHAAHLTAVGALGVSIAHEIGQPLTGITTSAEACSRWLDGNPPNIDRARQAVTRIVGDANRARDIVVRMRQFARKSPSPSERFGLNEVVGELVERVGDQLAGQNIALQAELEPGLADVEGDRVQIEQVGLNLILNAADALSQTQRSRYRTIVVRTRSVDDSNVMLEVEDTGPGVSAKTADQVFDAFFTTKAHGLGVGLAISRSIIEAHGGKIWIERTGDTGTVFALRLPGRK